jgi:adenylyl-sulfate kinase
MSCTIIGRWTDLVPETTDRTKASQGDLPPGGVTAWLTGLSGAGKSTIARLTHRELLSRGYRSELLDADMLRMSLSRDLDFSKRGREENVRRIGLIADLSAQQGAIVIVAAITPYRAMREELRQQKPHFIEVFVDAPLGVCERRDPKGLYRRARSGEIRYFTGIDDPYEPPLKPDLHCHTARETVDESVAKTVNYLLLTVRELGMAISSSARPPMRPANATGDFTKRLP